MAEPISIQQLKDASLDVKSLEEVVNGDENVVVTTRLGETYPSVKGSIKKLFENGGLPATPFSTKALMTASALIDGKYAQVTDDTVNNGLYIKTAGAWVKSAYDPVELANTYTDEKTDTILINSGKALHQWVDDELNIVGEIDANAGLRLVGIEGTVQEALKSGGGSGGQLVSNILNLTHAFVDDVDAVVAGFDTNAGLRLSDMTVSVQEYLDMSKEPTPIRNYTSKDLFATASNDYFINMAASNVKNAPVPFSMLPQRYSMPDAVVNEVSLPEPTAYIPLDTPYGQNDKVVHPYVIEFKGLFRGFRYLMCITPYAMESNENPTVFGSKDLASWELLTGFVQPLSTPQPTTYHSDNGFCYDPINGMLVCYFRETPIGEGANSTLYYRATRDGIDWTDKTIMLSPIPDSGYFSPSVLFNPTDGLWHLWLGKDAGQIIHYTARHLNDDWTLIGLCTGLYDWWHGEMKWVGDKYVTLGNKRDPNSNLYLATSIDGNTWVRGKMLWDTPQDAIYKASFLPRFNNLGQVAFDIFYTTNHAANPTWLRKFFHLTTNHSTSTITEI